MADALEHWRQVLTATGYFDPQTPRKLMPRLQQLLNRQSLTQEEIHILRGMARSVEQAIAQAPHGAPAPSQPPDYT